MQAKVWNSGRENISQQEKADPKSGISTWSQPYKYGNQNVEPMTSQSITKAAQRKIPKTSTKLKFTLDPFPGMIFEPELFGSSSR